nr:MAG TPA: hypothetical protein [Caudoviricetes sp.]DAP81879.1 MAG TPA: hypothetical protein [Caudoviricetes sp.]
MQSFLWFIPDLLSTFTIIHNIVYNVKKFLRKIV